MVIGRYVDGSGHLQAKSLARMPDLDNLAKYKVVRVKSSRGLEPFGAARGN